MTTPVRPERLEPRLLFATFLVSNFEGIGSGTLDQAVADANTMPGPDVIMFQSSLTGRLDLGATLNVSDSVEIRGPGANVLALGRPSLDEGDDRIFDIEGEPQVSVTIAGLKLVDGSSDSDGAGIRCSGASLTIDSCVFDNNYTPGGDGGAIATSGSLVARNTAFINNGATGSGGGGAISISGPSLTIQGCTFTGNFSSGGTFSGGAIDMTGEQTLIENSTISDNSQGEGFGGAVSVGGEAVIRNCTFIGNHVSAGGFEGDGRGAAIRFFGTTLTVVSSLFADNIAEAGDPDLFNDGTGIVNASNCLFESTLSAGTVTGTDVGNVFAQEAGELTLADNGGPTQTFALPEGSPAIDAGANPAGLQDDQRGTGFGRTSGAGTDIGAFELQQAQQVIPVITSIAPASLVATLDPQQVTVGGTDFAEDATVTLRNQTTGQALADMTIVSRQDTTAITVRALLTAGDWTAQVANPPLVTASDPLPFTVGTPPPLPDLTVTLSATLPSSVLAGARAAGAKASVLVRNQGTADFAGPVAVQLYLSADAALGDDLPVASVIKQLKLAQGQEKAVKVKIATFPAEANGAYRLIAKVDSADQITELGEGNNLAAGGESTIDVSPAYVDLLALGVAAPATLVRGRPGVVSVTVRNDGNAPTRGTAVVTSVSASGDGSAGGGDDVLLGTLEKPLKLKPNKTKQLRVRLVIPTNLPADNYTIVATVNADGREPERSGDNNSTVSQGAVTVS